MVSILIDFDNIIRSNHLSLLENRISPIPTTKHSLGLVLVITKKQYNSLQLICKGYGRVKYMNSEYFVDSISGYAYLIYDKKKRVCEIMNLEGSVLPLVMQSILGSIPNDVTLWIGTLLDDSHLELIKDYISVGFNYPYISKTSPLGFSFSKYAICMLRGNDIIDDNNATNDVKYVLTQFLAKKKGYCMLSARLSNNAIKYLRHASKLGSTLNNNGEITQKEIAGRLIAGIIEDDLTFQLDVDRDSIIRGDEEGVDIIDGLYNFHSHPQEAYDRHGVKLGWPSAQDYVGFMGSAIVYDTILHIVVCLEGFYVIFMSDYWVNKKELLGRDINSFILEKYDLCSEKKQPINWYVRKINNVTYKGFPLFTVQFISWDNPMVQFTAPYFRNGVNCFSRQSTIKKYKKLYT